MLPYLWLLKSGRPGVVKSATNGVGEGGRPQKAGDKVNMSMSHNPSIAATLRYIFQFNSKELTYSLWSFLEHSLFQTFGYWERRTGNEASTGTREDWRGMSPIRLFPSFARFFGWNKLCSTLTSSDIVTVFLPKTWNLFQ